MTYSVKEIFYTLQGEGANVGRPAVFCRFSGCNLWSGMDDQRSDSLCPFCDTRFVGTDGVGGGRFESASALAAGAANAWPVNGKLAVPKLLVCTGGEPLLQLDTAAIDAFHHEGFEIAVETNGTVPVPSGIDWVCVSPKFRAQCVVEAGDELKLIFPQDGDDPRRYERLQFTHFFLQPMDGPNRDSNVQLAVEYCLKHPRWRLSLQIHKLLGLQ